MKKILIILFSIFAVILGIVLFVLKKDEQPEQEFNSPPHVMLYDKGVKIADFEVEIASTSAQHQKGLMYREYLPENQGMFFIFNKEQSLSFWMKNTLIPLDIIYISEDKTVVSISADAQPCKKNPCPSYPSKENAMYVLEINGGLAKKFGIEKGVEVEFSLP